MKRDSITTDLAPSAIGPYSQAVKAGELLFISGQIPIDPNTGQLVSGGIDNQTRCVLKNLTGILASQSLTAEDVVKVTIFLVDMDHFSTINRIYGETFTRQPPARECVEVSRLPKDVQIEISAIAVYPGGPTT